MNNPVDQPKVSELLPCPFCGEVLEIRRGRNPYGRHAKDSECIMAVQAISIPHDVERWNRRTPQATTVGVTEALRQLSVLGDTFVPSGGFDDMHAGFVYALTVLRSALIGIPGVETGEAVNMGRRNRILELAGQARSAELTNDQEKFNQAIRSIDALVYAAPTSERVQALDDLLQEWIEAWPDLPMTDEELFILRNEFEKPSREINVWPKLMQMIVDHVRDVRMRIRQLDDITHKSS